MSACSVESCTIAKDGRCLEGKGTDCPHLLPDVAPGTTESPSGAATAVRMTTGHIPSEALYSDLTEGVSKAKELTALTCFPMLLPELLSLRLALLQPCE